MQNLFFEIIRVAIGTREGLSGAPTRDDWFAVYEMSKKQGVVGICFAGVQRLKGDADGRWCVEMPENLYYKWMAYSAQIRQKNEKVNRQCVALQTRLSTEGLRSCVLKGQGVAALYDVVNGNDGHRLSGLRQSGDIDIYVGCGREKAIAFARSIGQEDISWDYKHLRLNVFKETVVEMHYRAEIMFNLLKNKDWQQWSSKKLQAISRRENGIVTTTVDFDIVYVLLHAYRHLLGGGIGLRQIMDYFFVLKSAELNEEEWSSAVGVIRQFGMERFAKAVMWIMTENLGLPKDRCLVDCDEREGRFVLDEIMKGGNFGKHDGRFGVKKKGRVAIVLHLIRRNMHLLLHYPSEVCWVPFYFIWHFIWKRCQPSV